MLLNISTFVGKFHPLFVHLPIGFLLLAALLQWAGKRPQFSNIRVAVPITLLAGATAALFSCVTGYLLSLDGGYNDTTLDLHMWMGIITTIIAFVAWLISIRKIPIRFFQSEKALNIFLMLIVAGISFAGHWGGTLTHGEGYLSFSNNAGSHKAPVISDVNEAMIFRDIVQPILQHKCADCHNSNKMKGELSLQNFAQITKGGKHGVVVVNGKPAESELIKRVLLDPSDKKFMPTDGKPPLTKDETTLLAWWIEHSLQEDDQTVVSISPPDEIMEIIKNYFGAGSQSVAAAVPSKVNTTIQLTAPVLQADALQQLTNAGFVIKQIHYNPDLLDVTLPAGTKEAKSKLSLLSSVKENIVWLNISGNELTDQDLAPVASFTNLHRLRVDNNPITELGLQHIKTLQHLESINLCFTSIEPAALQTLELIPTLKSVYVWGTKLPQKDIVLRADSTLKIIAGEGSSKK